MKRVFSLLAATMVVAACQDSPVPTAAPTQDLAPVLSMAPQRGALADRYIVVFKSSVSDVDGEIDRAVRGLGAQVHYRYHSALKGFAATLPGEALQGISRNPNVAYVEADGEVSVVDYQSNPPSWGLDRIDQRSGTDKIYSYGNTGSGAHVYIIDTGTNPNHVEFSGRVAVDDGYDFVDGDDDPMDCHGHGTHVAGTVGGTNTGVAKRVQMVAVRVLDCNGSGSYAGVIAGIDWVTKNHKSPAVANMSLGGGKSTSINDAVKGSVSAGVVYAVAAGNESSDACRKSPASAPEAITVGATTSSDNRASYSNYGSCLDIFAPGSSIYSSVYSSTNPLNNTYATWNGTSMATPHVAGVAALYLTEHPNDEPAQVAAALTGNATAGVVGSAGRNSPNLLLYSGFIGQGGGGGGGVDPQTAVHIAGLDGSVASSNKKFWKAAVAITVVDKDGTPVAGATVSGGFSLGGSGSCTTDGTGKCSITSGNIPLGTDTTFEVTGISGNYDSTANTMTSVSIPSP
jgi:subtilisin family serine protease